MVGYHMGQKKLGFHMGCSGTLHEHLTFGACDNLGEEGSNRGKSTCKCHKVRWGKPGADETQNGKPVWVGQSWGWRRK